MPKRAKHRKPKSGKRILVQQDGGRTISSEKLPPIFSLRHVDKKYCISKCTKDERAALIDTMHRLSAITWRELRQAPRHGIGYEQIDRASINGRIPSHITDDVRFIAFRFYGKAPMAGYREEEIFHIIWIDRKFTLYSHS